MTTAGELKKVIAEFPDDAPVVLARQTPKGALKYARLSDHSDALLDMDEPDQWHDFDGQDSGMDDEEWQAFKTRATRILVLWS